MSIRFSLNRSCAPHISTMAFIALAQSVGAGAVELRNDVSGRELADGTDPVALQARIAAAGLTLASVNALQCFNRWNGDRALQARTLADTAARLGAPGIVLCPVVDADERNSAAERGAQLREALRQLRPILLDRGLLGYVEPLGMPASTLRYQKDAVAAVEDIGGWDAFSICHDTFQFFRCGDDEMFFEHIGLVHISGVRHDDREPHHLTEPDRGFVLAGDRVGNVEQLRRLLSAGYDGHVSMEAFDPQAQMDPAIAARLTASFQYVSGALRGPARAMAPDAQLKGTAS